MPDTVAGTRSPTFNKSYTILVLMKRYDMLVRGSVIITKTVYTRKLRRELENKFTSQEGLVERAVLKPTAEEWDVAASRRRTPRSRLFIVSASGRGVRDL